MSFGASLKRQVKSGIPRACLCVHLLVVFLWAPFKGWQRWRNHCDPVVVDGFLTKGVMVGWRICVVEPRSPN